MIKINKKGVKTTIVSVIGFGIIVALLVAMFMDKITAEDFFDGLTAVGASVAIFIGFLSKDYNQSHSKDKFTS